MLYHAFLSLSKHNNASFEETAGRAKLDRPKPGD
jgi:hypothetical protein